MNLPSVSDDITDNLAPLEEEMYSEWRLELARWSFTEGKNPEFGDGYPRSSMRQHFYRIDCFAAWVWSHNDFDDFTTSFTKEQADRYWTDELKKNDNALSTNRKAANSLALIFKHRANRSDDATEWSIPNSASVYNKINKESGTAFTDWFTIDELSRIKHASLSVYAVPDREDMEPGEQDEWAAHLAQRLRKAKGKLSDEDWNNSNSHKIPSLVYVSCDVGFRPIEIERSRWGWFNLDERVMDIPKNESSKNRDYWRCYISDESARLMKMWKRESYGPDGPAATDPVWLTREGNPYSAESLRRPVMQNLMDEAGINRNERENGWYMIRRGVGTDLGTKRGLNAVMNQLRITNVETAERYVRHDERGVRDWLNNR
jgi:integrase